MSAEDNVVKMPIGLERRAQKIDAALERQRKAKDNRDRSDDEWREATLDLAVELAAVKSELPALQDFGKWCEGRFGDNTLPKDERAILIQWGADAEGTRSMLAKTNSRSVQVINKRFRSATKTPKTTPPREEVEAWIEEHLARSGEYPSVAIAAKESGWSRIVVEPALAAVIARNSVAPSELRFTKAQEAHIEARIRAMTKQLEKDFSERVRLGVLEGNADYLAALNQLQKEASEKWERYDTLLNSYKPIFTDAEYRDLLLCTHEANPSEGTRKRAFMALNAMKFQLTGKK